LECKSFTFARRKQSFRTPGKIRQRSGGFLLSNATRYNQETHLKAYSVILFDWGDTVHSMPELLARFRMSVE
jgi:hypothetical protein